MKCDACRSNPHEHVVLVTGGRDFSDANSAFLALDALDPQPNLVVHGGCAGADSLADAWCRNRGIPMAIYPALWSAMGKAAGPLRNQYMLEFSRAHTVVAFPGGAGTASMVKLAKQRKVPVLDVRVYR